MPRRLPLALLVAVALTSPAASALALSPGGMGAAGAVSAACRPPSLPAAADEDAPSLLEDRREALGRLALAPPSFAAALLGRSLWASAAAAAPVLILGGSGRTAMEVAEALASRGTPVVVSTRTGSYPYAKVKLPADLLPYVSPYPDPVDVRDASAVEAAVRGSGAGAVVYAASASRAGGNAAEVDGDGAANAARAAKGTGARLVLVSALALDRPGSKSYRVTNTMGGYIDHILDEKLRGEEAVRTVLGRGTGNYVILRPGPLLKGRTKGGASGIELNQGDTVGGGLSRDELAGLVAGAVASDAARGVTVECYRSQTATALQPEYTVPSGREQRADTYDGMFAAAAKDK